MTNRCLAIPFVLLALDVQAQVRQPTYQQTVDWITSKANLLGSSTRDFHGLLVSIAFSNLHVDSCVLQYHTDVTHYWIAYPYKEVEEDDSIDITVPMSSGVSAVANEMFFGIDAPWNVKLLSRSQSIHVQGTMYSPPGHESATKQVDYYQAAAYYVLTFGEPNSDHGDIATRMAKALNYLASLCAAPVKKEPF